MTLRTRLARQAAALAVAGLGVAGPVWAERVSSDLAIIPSANSNRLNLTVTATIALGTRSDSDTATISGNVLTDTTLLFDPVLAELIDQVTCDRDGAGGPWTGKGITSSAARADVAGLTSIGVFLNSTRGGSAVAYSEFGGVPVDANSILMRATWLGDANVDGIVDADDFFLIDRGFRTQEGGWYNGDFNYDGVVNALDYVLIDRSFLGQSVAVVPRAASVPKPSAVGIGVVGLSLLCRRRWAGI